VKRLASAVPLLLLCAAASGCLTVADDDGPILSIELFWDARPETNSFVGGTCLSADVESMEWRLILHHEDGEDEVVAEREEKCHNAIDVLEPERGDYTLEVTGRTEDGDALWNVECTGLTVLRFDVAYECDIEAP
jgi:hypothetical protein